MNKGQFELLLQDIEKTLVNAEGSYRVTELGRLVIDVRIPERPELSNNGGDYYVWRKYEPSGFGVQVWDDWSCDFSDMIGADDLTYECLVSLSGLERMAKMALLTITARKWLSKEPGYMASLKNAVMALSEVK